MMAEDILSRLDHVRRAGRGWTARCPAHEDRSPSLSVHEGDRGVLLKCWTGCSLEEICAVLGLRVPDLFYESKADPQRIRATHRHRERKAAVDQVKLKRADVFREAEGVIRAATGVDISQWTPDQIDQAMEAVAVAHLILLNEGADHV